MNYPILLTLFLSFLSLTYFTVGLYGLRALGLEDRKKTPDPARIFCFFAFLFFGFGGSVIFGTAAVALPKILWSQKQL